MDTLPLDVLILIFEKEAIKLPCICSWMRTMVKKCHIPLTFYIYKHNIQTIQYVCNNFYVPKHSISFRFNDLNNIHTCLMILINNDTNIIIIRNILSMYQRAFIMNNLHFMNKYDCIQTDHPKSIQLIKKKKDIIQQKQDQEGVNILLQ